MPRKNRKFSESTFVQAEILHHEVFVATFHTFHYVLLNADAY